MKSGIETGDLKQVGEPPMKCLGQQDFLRQMIGIERAELVQLINHRRGDALRFPVLRAAMDHAMPHGSQRATLDFFFNPIHQDVHRRGVIGHNDRS
jgi:hypothetical protein